VIIREGCLKGGGRVEAVGAQDIGNAAIEAFKPTIGLGPSGLDQAVFDVFIGADPIKGGQALVGERSPVAQKRSVNALPLSVRTLLMMMGALSIRRPERRPRFGSSPYPKLGQDAPRQHCAHRGRVLRHTSLP